ncbi:MAG: cbb3-type cytochrome oxidase assembly protein CcoS [Sphingomicrobium sp.]
MNGLALLIPIALLMGLSGLAAFFWSLESGQYDDLDGSAMRILIDDEEAKEDKPIAN